jgi:hypothetical protein
VDSLRSASVSAERVKNAILNPARNRKTGFTFVLAHATAPARPQPARRTTRWRRSSPRGASAPRLARRCARSSRLEAAPRDRGALPRRSLVPTRFVPLSRAGHQAGSCRRRRHRRAPWGRTGQARAAHSTWALDGVTCGYTPLNRHIRRQRRRGPSSRGGRWKGCPPLFCLDCGGSRV